MKGFRILLLLGAAALALPAWAQNELPSAPSAVKQSPPPPPPQPEPAKAAPPPASKPPAQPAAVSKEAASPAASASPAPEGDQGPPLATIVKRVDEVNVVFTVTDKH